MYKYLQLIYLLFFINSNYIKYIVSYKIPLVIGNWKMNTNLESSIHLSYYLLSNRKIQYKNIEVAILPPIPFISNIKNILKKSNITPLHI